MAKRKKSSTRKRKSTIKLPLSVIITLIIIAAIVIGVWAALHPAEAKYYVQTWTEQYLGWPTRPTQPQQQPAQPIPPTEGSDNLAYGVPGPSACIIDREGRERRNQNRRSSVRGCQVGEIGKSAGEMQLLCVAGKIRRACPRWNFLES